VGVTPTTVGDIDGWYRAGSGKEAQKEDGKGGGEEPYAGNGMVVDGGGVADKW
jgi:hypothetical protein